ncbi:MAG: ABC transporter ATP-binding protein [Candidatus Sumerlaeota bacterium]
MGDPLIRIRGLRKRFGDEQVLDGVDLDIEEGKVTAIIGRSGVGKSVLLKHLVGLMHPDGGEIFFRGKNVNEMDAKERTEMKSHFSYMFQNNALFDSMTNYDNVALPLREKTDLGEKKVEEKVMDIFHKLDLHDIAGKFPSEISGGMRKRVALGRALITDPEIILFDEPTTGLDPIRKDTVYRMIEHNQKFYGFTAVVVTHDIPDIFDYAQYVAMLSGGVIGVGGDRETFENTDDREARDFLEGRSDSEFKKTASSG